MIEFLGIEIAAQQVLLGLVTGLTYAAFAAGFILVYRSTGVLNFAHGETGAFCVALFVLLLVRFELNWWLAFGLSVLAGAAIGMVIELIVVRRLFNSPRLVLLIATIGVSQVLVFAKISLPKVIAGGPIPLPFDMKWEFWELRILAREFVVVLIVPILIAALAWFLTRTRFGLAVRASASNPDTARVYGTSPRRTSTIVWTISGAFAAITAIMFAPLQGINAAQAGTSAIAEPLLLRVLVVSLFARMRSLPGALAAGLGVGVVEQLVRSNVDSSNRSIVDLYLFLAVLVVVVFVKRIRVDDASWSLSPRTRPIPERLRQIWWVRNLSAIGFAVIFGFFLVLPLIVTSASGTFIWTNIIVWAMITLSLTVLTGWAGQLSLGQFALVGLGGMTTLALTSDHDIPIPFNLFDLSLDLPWLVAIILATAVGVVAALLVGLPALRVKGLFLAVTTLAFAVAAASWLFDQDVFTGGTTTPRPAAKPVVDWGPIEIDFGESRRSYYYLCLGALALSAAVVARIRRTGSGRSMIAVRENEEMAAASTVSPARLKLTAFAVSGGIAALAGGLFVTLQPSLQPTTLFTAGASISVVATAIIGGLGSIAGPILGTLWVRGIPELIPDELDDLVRLLTSDIGLLILLMYFPGGILQVVYKVRDAAFDYADRRLPEETRASAPATAKVVPTRPDSTRPALAPGQPALATHNVTVRFGGNVAVSDVSINVQPNELVGLIGTNGAGKSTLLNAISGFVRSTGRIEVLGEDVSSVSAARRHSMGLGRGFQAAKLYPDLTVRESLMVALEAREKSLLVPSMTGLPPSRSAERRKRTEADELVDYLGLGRYAEQYIGNLSTGTRRIVELGSLLAVDAKVLLLDEPTGGVAQRETEAFGPLIKRIQQELEASVIVIEHDMPLIMAISDRVYCLEAGSVIAEGTPDEVRNNPAVIASYLGTDERAIQRSNTGA
ncbi:MAG: ATP-binding cassette domain-containing protein [Acidimicrobiales bacterium]|nr:ATP-binding cassette domain-containing protein [Acidimicrobiales bacterium]